MFNRYRDWKRRQEAQRVAKWSKIRQKGKSHFVSGFALQWGFGMTVLFSVVKYLYGEPFHIAHVIIYLVLSFLGGLIVGLSAWSSREREYFKYHPEAEEIYNITGREV